MDRSSKATLPLTIPGHIFKSYAKDSSPQSFGISIQSPQGSTSTTSRETLDTCSGGRTSAPIISRVTIGEAERATSSMDSDLEAFSHNPTHGSFAPLAFQPSAMTNYVNQRGGSLAPAGIGGNRGRGRGFRRLPRGRSCAGRGL